MVSKSALDTHEFGGEVNTASTGLYNERRSISNVKDGIGKSSLVTRLLHAKETVKLLHLRQQPKEDNMLADDRGFE